ncbi:MAG TPA: helix-hairpin-helix domain-containing protein [Bacteroidia bacterium]
MKPFEFLHKYFGFNKRERNGIVILTGIIVVLIFARIFIPSGAKDIEVDIKKLEALEQKKNETLPEENNHSSAYIKTDKTSKNNFVLFPFDPNTVTAEEATQLGFSEKTANILVNFRNKGGKFKTKEDLKKLYGLKEELYTKLEPYITIQQTKPAEEKSAFVPYAKPKPSLVELNTADSTQIVYLPMIGPGFTKRILKFRNALGGFYKVEQLKEVYGMADSTYNAIKDKITINTTAIKKLNVNVAGIDELKKHPYINYTIANSIVNYRSKHGLYKSLDDLKEVGTINDATLEKLAAYLSF